MDTGTSTFSKARLAPTPSGYLHLGNILSFAITVAVARKTGASILLRIDDMDQERAQDSYVQNIFDTLRFLELPWDEGPENLQEFKQQYSQTHRLHKYHEALEYLQSNNKVFACTCSRSQLQQHTVYPGTCIPGNYPLSTPQANWRLHTSPAEEVAIKHIDGKIITATLPDQMQSVVVRKKDRMPAYQLSSIIDDLYFGVDLIVRGNDLWPSTITQLCLAKHLPENSFHQTTFYHHPLITDSEGKKLSKSAGASSVQHLIKEGKKKEEIYQLLAQHMGLTPTGVHDWQSLAASLEYFQTGARR